MGPEPKVQKNIKFYRNSSSISGKRNMDSETNVEKNLTYIDKLTSDNYSIWSFKIKALMQEKEVWSAIEDEKPKDETKHSAWNKINQKALNTIILSVSNSQIIYIKSAKTAKEAWESLEKEHKKSGVGSKTRVFKNIFHMTLKKGSSMREHLNVMLNYFDQLAEMGSPLPPDMSVNAILASLNDDYSSIVTAIEAWDEDRLTMQNVKSILIEEYEKKQSQVSGEIMKIENIEADKYKNLECGYCHKIGHIKKNCYKIKFNKEKIKQVEEIENKIKAKAQEAAVKMIQQAESQDEKMEWYVDSGASLHICSNLSFFRSIQNTDEKFKVANGHEVKANGVGTIETYIISTNNQKIKLILKNVLYLKNNNFSNIISVAKLLQDNCSLHFENNCCSIKINKDTFTTERKLNGLFVLASYKFNFQEEVFNIRHKFCVHEWHKILSHRNLDDIKKMKARGIKFRECICSDQCEACIQGKLAKKSFPKKAHPVESILDVICSDVCGPFEVVSIQGYKYLVTFVDIFSNYTEVKFIKEKSEVPQKVIEFIESIKVQFRRKPKIFRSDRGTEYLNQVLQSYLRKEGIKTQTTVGYAPEQNGVAERKNRTLVEAARTMLIDSKLPKFLWSEAINEANYNLNRVISKDSQNSAFEKFYSKSQAFRDFHEFGSEVYVMIPEINRKKLDVKARKCIYLGHDTQAKGYRIYDPDSRNVKISRNVVFLKNQIKVSNDQSKVNTSKVTNPELRNSEIHNQQLRNSGTIPVYYNDISIIPEIQNEVIPIEEDDEEFHDAQEEVEQPVQASITENEIPNQVERVNQRPVRSTAGKLPSRFADYEVNSIFQYTEPRSYKEAIQCLEKDKWIEAMNEEIKCLNDNNTWNLVNLPESKHAVGSKWVFKRKLNENNQVVSYKARLVAQGFSQKFGTDYDEVFAPVIRPSTFRLLLAVSAKRKYIVKQFDIKSAFLNGELQEEIYLKQPPGFQINNQVYRLKKSLYGLKQAARVWNSTIHQVFVENNFKQSQIDKCLYIKHLDSNSCYIIIHVDDILIAGSDEDTVNQIRDKLSSKFQIKDLGQIKYFLGIQIKQDSNGDYFINQESYIDKIVIESKLSDAKSSKFPLDTGYYKLQNSDLLPDNEEYRKLIGMLLYISTNTRPDISSSVSILSQKVCKPSKLDLNEVKRVIRYLNCTKKLNLRLSNQNSVSDLIMYSDANWAEDRVDRKSNSGYIIFGFGGTISWACRKQISVSLSSTEAEYIALSEATQELIWQQRLAQDFSINIQYPVKILADNQSAIKMIDNHKFSNSTKHIETRYHYIKDIKEQGLINVKYVPAEDNIADMLTKALGGIKIKELRTKAGLQELD